MSTESNANNAIAVLSDEGHPSAQQLALREGMSKYITAEHSIAILDLGRGLLKFTESTFPDAASDKIYAKPQQREPAGKGPHFDVYDDLVAEDFPWLGIYNFAGTVSVKAALLPQNLTDHYRKKFPEPSKAAHIAREQYSFTAFCQHDLPQVHGTLSPHTGLVIAQRKDLAPVIHELTPINTADPGNYVKLLRPRTDASTQDTLKLAGFVTLDEYVTQQLTSSGARLRSPAANPVQEHGLSGFGEPALLD